MGLSVIRRKNIPMLKISPNFHTFWVQRWDVGGYEEEKPWHETQE